MIDEANKIISVYTSDTSGVCSALYELDGMVIMHDASGCNSTYNTHDEPRWYDIQSRVYLSGINEYEAILGDDEKLIKDIVQTAKEQNPKFIAISATPIPYLMNQDLYFVAKEIERRTTIPSFYIESNGMNSYLSGASKAFLKWAQRFVKKGKIKTKNAKKKINLLGATPLDFPNYDIIESIIDEIEKMGFEINSVWAMGPYTKNMENSNLADYNLVLSSVGLDVAKYLKNEFDIPYLLALPFGKKQSELIKKAILANEEKIIESTNNSNKIAIIGESIYSKSIKNLIGDATIHTLLEDKANILDKNDVVERGEKSLLENLKNYEYVIADPLFKHLVSENTKFIEFPHFAFSGRMFKNNCLNIVGEKGDIWKKELGL